MDHRRLLLQKKLVWKCRSINIIVTQPAKIGMTANNKNAVTNQLHTNNGNLIQVMPGARILNIVTTIFNAAIIDDAPIK